METTPCIVAIAGPSCSGKSTLARALIERIPAASLLALDNYYRDQRGTSDHDIEVDVPEALDSALLVAHVVALSRGQAIEVPVYDFKMHARTGRTRGLVPRDVVVVEGLFALYWADIRRLLAGSVFVTADDDVCLARRIARDTRERGRSQASISHQYRHKVRPMYERYVAPTERYADLVLDGETPVSNLVERVMKKLDRWKG